MIVGKALTAILLASAEVVEAVGSNIAAQQTPEPTRLGSYPGIVYESHGADNQTTNDGRSGLVQQTVRIYCEATDYPTADLLSQQVNTVLIAVTKGTYGGIVVHGIFFQDEDEGVVAIPGAFQDAPVFFKSLDYKIWFYLPAA